MNKEGKGEGIRGSVLPYSETVLYFPGSTLSLTRSSMTLDFSAFLKIHFHHKTTIKAERSDVELKQKNAQADRL